MKMFSTFHLIEKIFAQETNISSWGRSTRNIWDFAIQGLQGSVLPTCSFALSNRKQNDLFANGYHFDVHSKPSKQ
jgi:hypothetical protein